MKYILILLILVSSCKKTIEEKEVTISSMAFIKNGYVHLYIKSDKIINAKGSLQAVFTTKWQTNFIASVPTPYNHIDTICKTIYPADSVYNFKIFSCYIFGVKVKY